MEKNSIPKITSPFSVWLSYLERLHSRSIDMGLERISQIAARLGVVKPAPFVFTVAGTNGKGTTCRVLEMILIQAGYRVGVYSSPHFIRHTERVRIQNAELPESLHIGSFAEIEIVRDDIPLTYFEYTTLSALLLFQQAQLDVVILEVGLGGRLDATNMVSADVAVITSIALDHTDWLGSDRESIGREKAGIFRPKKPAVVGDPDMPLTISKVAKEKGACLLRCGVDWLYTVTEDSWSFTDALGQLDNLPLPQVPQPNAATALAAVRVSGLMLSEQAIKIGIQNAILPGRFQIISESPRIILDVAHNPHAAAHLVKRLALLPKKGRTLAVIGMLNDKDVGGTLACIERVADCFYFASLEGPRGASAEQLMEHLGKGITCSTLEKVWETVMLDVKQEDIILVCGSFRIVAYVMGIVNSGELSVVGKFQSTN